MGKPVKCRFYALRHPPLHFAPIFRQPPRHDDRPAQPHLRARRENGKTTSLIAQEYFVSLKDGEMVVRFVVDYPQPKFVNFDMSISKPKALAKTPTSKNSSK